MSSKRKDARWQGAYNVAETIGLEFEDFSGSGWTKLLQQVEDYMKETPEAEEWLYSQWEQRTNEI